MSRVDAAHLTQVPQLSDYREIAEILRSRLFVQGAYGENRREFMFDTLPTLDGDRHMARRRIYARLFGDEAVARSQDAFVAPAIAQARRDILAAGQGDGPGIAVDLAPLSQRFFYRVAAATIGIDGVDSAENVDRFITQTRDIAGGLTLDWTKEDPAVVAERARRARAEFRARFFQPSLERRKAAGGEAGQSASTPDALTLMLLHRAEAWADDDSLLREVTLLLTAATQSTSAALILLILRLDQWFKTHPEDRQNLVDDPQFLRHAVFESVRLTTGAPARVRMPVEDVVLHSGRRIGKGEKVALLLMASNTGAEFGADATEFNPHRLTEGVPPWGHAFGGGAHTCLGRPLVTGSREIGQTAVDGVLAMVARQLYQWGLEFDPGKPPVKDESTHYHVYARVPVVFTRLHD